MSVYLSCRFSLTDVRDGTIYRAVLLQFVWQLQKHIAEANQDVSPEDEDMRVYPHVYPLCLILYRQAISSNEMILTEYCRMMKLYQLTSIIFTCKMADKTSVKQVMRTADSHKENKS